MRVIRSIALDLETAKIADKIPNFSKWVRVHLAVYGGSEDSLHTMDEVKRLNHGYRIQAKERSLQNPYSGKWETRRYIIPTHRCDPHHTSGQCQVCWPLSEGPLQDQISTFLEAEILKDMESRAHMGDDEE
jgi:hypothetical protein